MTESGDTFSVLLISCVMNVSYSYMLDYNDDASSNKSFFEIVGMDVSEVDNRFWNLRGVLDTLQVVVCGYAYIYETLRVHFIIFGV